MALKIRLRKQGSNNRPFYRLVVAEVRTKRDGKYLENLGWYNPLSPDENNVLLKEDRILHWLNVGAMISDNVVNLVKRRAPALAAKMNTKAAAK
jgi:small subunit ribosomal protein S16